MEQKLFLDDLMARYCAAVRWAFNRLLEGTRTQDIRVTVHKKFGFNSRQANDAVYDGPGDDQLVAGTSKAEPNVRSRLLGFPVDVCEASPGFRYHAAKGLVLWSRDEEKRYDFAKRAWMTYFDYQPVIRQIFDDLIADLGACAQKTNEDQIVETLVRQRFNVFSACALRILRRLQFPVSGCIILVRLIELGISGNVKRHSPPPRNYRG